MQVRCRNLHQSDSWDDCSGGAGKVKGTGSVQWRDDVEVKVSAHSRCRLDAQVGLDSARNDLIDAFGPVPLRQIRRAAAPTAGFIVLSFVFLPIGLSPTWKLCGGSTTDSFRSRAQV